MFKEFCDRCGKEITIKDKLNISHINFFRFLTQFVNCDLPHVIYCRECCKSFKRWYGSVKRV